MHEDPTRADVRAENARVASPAEEFGEAYEPWIIELGELDEKMGVVVEEQSAERVVATMPVEGNRQSLGLLHGGASVALGEMLERSDELARARQCGLVARPAGLVRALYSGALSADHGFRAL